MEPARAITNEAHPESQPATTKETESRSFHPVSYARDLRVVGQALEAHQIFNLNLVAVAGVYAIRGEIQAPMQGGLSDGFCTQPFLVKIAAILRGGNFPKRYPQTIDLRYGIEEVVLLDQVGRSKRRDPKSVPSHAALSQILRGVGAYLDVRDGTSLIGASIEDRWVTICFETATGRPQEAKQDVEYFYDFSVKMYLRRKDR